MSLDETKEQYNTVVKASNLKAQQRKMDILTRNLDQLVSIQRQLVDQNQSLKKDITVAEKKLFARNERIQSLEVLLHEAQSTLEQQDARFTAQMTEIQKRLHSAQESRPLLGVRIQIPNEIGRCTIKSVLWSFLWSIGQAVTWAGGGSSFHASQVSRRSTARAQI
jgi:flagellar basal body rod protein FlgC